MNMDREKVKKQNRESKKQATKVEQEDFRLKKQEDGPKILTEYKLDHIILTCIITRVCYIHRENEVTNIPIERPNSTILHAGMPKISLRNR